MYFSSSLCLVDEKMVKFEVIVEILHLLWDAIDAINNLFTFQMIFIVFHLFVSNILSCFNIISASIHNEEFAIVLFSEGSFVVVNMFAQMVCVHSCYSLTTEAERSSVLISRLNNRNSCGKVLKLCKNLLIQADKRNFKVQNCFFTLNWKLLLTVSLLRLFAA
jgi:hypothetical protein